MWRKFKKVENRIKKQLELKHLTFDIKKKFNWNIG